MQDACINSNMLPKMGCALALLTLVWTANSAAQIAQFEGQQIVDIQYSPAQVLDSEDLTVAQPIKKGDTLHAHDVATAIDGLFATGRFDDIKVEAEKMSTNGVTLRFITQPRQFIGGVSVNGKFLAPPDSGALQSNGQLS